MMKKDEILAEFEAAEAILSGHFILSSGLHSDTYLQCARVLMDPARAGRLCEALVKQLTQAVDITAIDTVIAPAMGGLIVGYEMARQLQKPFMFCERQNGEFAFRRGFELAKGARILVVEDVVTTGLSSKETFAVIEQAGATVVAEAALIDRSVGKANLGVPFASLLQLDVQSYDSNHLPPHLQALPAEKPGSRHLKA